MKTIHLVIALLAATFLQAADNLPNFVFILADDMGWTGISVQVHPGMPDSRSDYYLTPNLEKLAARSMVFSNAYAPGPMCTPSRAAILTGKTPAELHMTAPGGGQTDPAHRVTTPRIVRELPEAEITIAELLKQKGYATAYFGKWHQGQVSPARHGFDSHDGSPGNEIPEPKNGPKDIFGVNDRAISFIERQATADRPFYVQLSHWAVHGPFESGEASEEKFAAMDKGMNHTDPVYAGMTWDLDASIGILMDKLAQLNLLDNTFVIFMSDNGAPGGERQGGSNNAPLRAGKATLYEGGIRVPLMVRGPGVRPGSFSGVSVTGCDLYPTIGELAGIELQHTVAGSSLVPLLMGVDGFEREHALLFHYPHYGRNPRVLKPQSAVIRGNYKLIRDQESGADALYDLNADVSETTDIGARLPEIKASMALLLDRRLVETGAQLNVPNTGFDTVAEPAPRAGPGQGRPGSAGSQGGRGPLDRDAMMERFDKDKDGRITRAEFDGPAPRWQRLDADGDGIVLPEDIPETAQPRRVR